MSQHVEEFSATKYVFGWDQPLQSFYFQKHDLTLPEDERIIVRLGATPQTRMYEVEDFACVVAEHGLILSPDMRSTLYGDKDDGR